MRVLHNASRASRRNLTSSGTVLASQPGSIGRNASISRLLSKPRGLDHIRPAIDVGADERGEFLWRATEPIDPDALECTADCFRLERIVRSERKLLDDCRRRASWCQQADPDAGV